MTEGELKKHKEETGCTGDSFFYQGQTHGSHWCRELTQEELDTLANSPPITYPFL